MPTYVVASKRLHVAAWKHGVSLYGWNSDDDGGFVERHSGDFAGCEPFREPAQVGLQVDDPGDRHRLADPRLGRADRVRDGGGRLVVPDGDLRGHEQLLGTQVRRRVGAHEDADLSVSRASAR